MKRPVIYYYDNQELDEFTYKIYLLNKYLTKDYGEENAIAILEEYSSNLDDLAKMLGAEDFSFFCLYFLSNIFVVKSDNNARQLAAAHYELWEIANDVFIKDKFDKGCIIEPRGLAKTTIFNMAVNIWLVCYKKSQFTLVGAKKDSDAQQFLDSIKVQFNENQLIIKVFGKLIDKKKYTVNANEIEFTNGCYIRAVGSGTSVRGANFKGVRPQVVIADKYNCPKIVETL